MKLKRKQNVNSLGQDAGDEASHLFELYQQENELVIPRDLKILGQLLLGRMIWSCTNGYWQMVVCLVSLAMI